MMQLAASRRFIDLGRMLIWSIVLAAWSLALVIPAFGHGGALAHHAIASERAIPPLSTLLIFLIAWQVMTAAMMLPSSLPVIGLFVRASRGQARPGLTNAAFLAAYFAVWTGFALVALLADGGLHRLVARWSWLAERPWLIAGTVVIVAGAFQFSPLKERCLDVCRTPVNFLLRHYQRGTGAAWSLGLRHGLYCLGCCWALMLTMFAVGIGSLVWMATLTGVMLIEKTTSWGRHLAAVVGGVLIVWGLLLLLHPGWLPALLDAG